MVHAARHVFHKLNRYRRDEKGAAAVEFALVVTLLTVPVLNVIDLAMYAWDRMQLDNAAQMGAQAAWTTCSAPANWPATPNAYANCAGMPAAVTRAVQSTSLGAAVTVTSTGENYYCLNTNTNTLAPVGNFPNSKPANCGGAAGGLATDRPGDYVQITTSYTFTPIFPAVSIASALAPNITRTAWMRLG
jgi:Flp pilus assembly protein TadG